MDKKLNITLSEEIIEMLDTLRDEVYISRNSLIRLLIKREYDKELQTQICDLRTLNNELMEKNKRLTIKLMEKDKKLKRK